MHDCSLGGRAQIEGSLSQMESSWLTERRWETVSKITKWRSHWERHLDINLWLTHTHTHYRKTGIFPNACVYYNTKILRGIHPPTQICRLRFSRIEIQGQCLFKCSPPALQRPTCIKIWDPPRCVFLLSHPTVLNKGSLNTMAWPLVV